VALYDNEIQAERDQETEAFLKTIFAILESLCKHSNPDIAKAAISATMVLRSEGVFDNALISDFIRKFNA